MKLLKSTHWILMSFLFALLLFAGFAGTAAGESLAGDAAIKGYDTTAYFKAGKALKGNESFTFKVRTG